MTQQFDGKVALVTGAGAGIGRAAAIAFAGAGARVVVSDVRADSGEETVARIRAAEGSREAAFVRADVSRSEDVAALVAQAVATYGRLDCAFNNAGVSGVAAPDAGGGPTHLHSEELWQQVIAINLTGVWLCMKHEIAQMLQQGGGGTIVNAASASSFRGTPAASAYAASKHGIIGITKSAALEYAPAGIRVNAVAPGAIETPMWEPLFAAMPDFRAGVIARQPVGRMGTPDEVAAAVLWLCSDAASFVTGHALVLDGGYLAQ